MKDNFVIFFFWLKKETKKKKKGKNQNQFCQIGCHMEIIVSLIGRSQKRHEILSISLLD